MLAIGGGGQVVKEEEGKKVDEGDTVLVELRRGAGITTRVFSGSDVRRCKSVATDALRNACPLSPSPHSPFPDAISPKV